MELFHRCAERFQEGFPGELVEDSLSQPLHKAVGPEPRHLGTAVLNADELREGLVRVNHWPVTGLSATIARQDVFDLLPLHLAEGQHSAMEHIDGCLLL